MAGRLNDIMKGEKGMREGEEIWTKRGAQGQEAKIPV